MPKAKDQAPASPQIHSTVTLTEDDLPEIKNWSVGSTYKVVLELQQTGADAHPDAEGDVPSEARFKVVSAKILGSKSKDQGDMGGMQDQSMMGDQPTDQGASRKKVIDQIGQKAKQY